MNTDVANFHQHVCVVCRKPIASLQSAVINNAGIMCCSAECAGIKLTPRTDAQPIPDAGYTLVFRDFARTLEQELASLERSYDYAKAELGVLVADVRRLGAAIPCNTGGTFQNDPSDAIIDAAIRTLKTRAELIAHKDDQLYRENNQVLSLRAELAAAHARAEVAERQLAEQKAATEQATRLYDATWQNATKWARENTELKQQVATLRKALQDARRWLARRAAAPKVQERIEQALAATAPEEKP